MRLRSSTEYGDTGKDQLIVTRKNRKRGRAENDSANIASSSSSHTYQGRPAKIRKVADETFKDDPKNEDVLMADSETSSELEGETFFSVEIYQDLIFPKFGAQNLISLSLTSKKMREIVEDYFIGWIGRHSDNIYSLSQLGFTRTEAEIFFTRTGHKIRCLGFNDPSHNPLNVIRYFPNLEKLSVANSVLGQGFFEALAEMKELKDVSLVTSRAISVISDKKRERYLAKMINNAEKLQHLTSDYFFESQQTFEGIVTKNTLKTLNLPNTYFGNQDLKSLSKLPFLETLSIPSSPITDKHVKAFAEMKSLRSLTLNIREVTNEGIRKLASMDSLTHLHLIGRNLSLDDVKAIASMNNLTSLAIVGCGIDSEKVKALWNMTGLETLDLSNNVIEDDGMDGIEKMRNSLTNLNLSGNAVSFVGVEKIAKVKNLESLDLSKNMISDACFKALAKLFFLISLNLSNNEIYGVDLNSLHNCVQLQHLNLSTTFFCNPTVKNLWEIKSLTSLDLSSALNGTVSFKGIEALKSLISLNVSKNRLDNSLVLELRKVPTLQHLNLSNNRIDGTVFQDLTALEDLRSLNLEGNIITSVNVVELLKMMPKLESLKLP